MFAVKFENKLRVYAEVSLLILLATAFTLGFQIRLVHAAPLTIDVSPSSAPVGDTLTISGADATANGEVRVYVMDYLFLTTTSANETGGYSVDVNVPTVPLGTYSIMAVDVTSSDTASTTFDVEPRVLLTPTTAGYSQSVSVKGEGFNSDSDVTLTFDGMDVSPWPLPHTDFLGSFTASFSVPSRTNGTYTFTADDALGGSASVLFNVVPNLLLWPTSGSSLTVAFVQGYGFAGNTNVTIHFGSTDVTPYPWMTTWFDGSFGAPLFVPDVSDGAYTVEATDDTGLTATAIFVVPGPILTLTPDKVFDSSLVKVKGMGFQPRAPILLYLEDITMTNLIDLMWMSPNLFAEDDGSFEYSFIVPVTSPGVYNVTAYMMSGPPPSELLKLASTSIVIVDDSPLDVKTDVGSLHFRGEIAEFYVETSFKGKPVDAIINTAKLYWNGTLKQVLTTSVGHVTTGLYRIPYSIAANATVGSYSLMVEASYITSLVDAYGTSSGSFLLSAGFTDQNARLIDVQGKIGTIVVPDLGILKANLTTINARLTSVDGNVATIQSDLGTLQTDADAIHAKVVSIDGNVATISSDLGTVKTQVTSQMTTDTPDYQGLASMVLSLVAAAGAIVAVLYVRRIKPPTPVSAASQPPSPPPTTTAPTGTPTTPPVPEAEEIPNETIPDETPPIDEPIPETPTVPLEPETPES